MSSTRDYLRSVVTDAVLPISRQLFEDVVMEVMSERQIPSRTDFRELRDVVNGMRGKTSSAASGAKKNEKRIASLENRLDELVAERDALVERLAKLEKPKRTRAKKK
ncbi:MAG: hypothetical protein GY913_14370 [Proteobacteria bacterium]|nr:hypothetical protein [Pseudomonadota bacterium]MCP4918094.1 hypothetical protein [Pseudomonadota bacterium]